MKTLIRIAGLFVETSKAKIAQAMAYRLNFILHSIISLLFSCIGPVLQFLIFSQTKGFPGWNLEQIVLFQGILLFHLGLRNTLFGSLHFELPEMLRKGQFDRLLLKPYPAIGTILSSGFDANNFGSIIAGGAIIAYSAVRMDLGITIAAASAFTGLIFLGLFLYTGFEILYSSAVIVLVHMGRLHDILGMLNKFGEYPLEIFTRSVQVFFITAVPMAVWVNYPARILLGRGSINILLSLAFSFIFFVLSLAVWNRSLKNYTSAGG